MPLNYPVLQQGFLQLLKEEPDDIKKFAAIHKQMMVSFATPIFPPSPTIGSAGDVLEKSLLGQLPILLYEDAFVNFSLEVSKGMLASGFNPIPPIPKGLSFIPLTPLSTSGAPKESIAATSATLVLNWFLTGKAVNPSGLTVNWI